MGSLSMNLDREASTEREGDTKGEGSHITGVLRLQGKEYQGLLANTRSKGKQGRILY